MQFLNGYKTYIAGGGITALSILKVAGTIPPEISDAVDHLVLSLIGVAFMALRNAVPEPVKPFVDPLINTAEKTAQEQILKRLDELEKKLDQNSPFKPQS